MRGRAYRRRDETEIRKRSMSGNGRKPRDHLTPEERAALGKQARASVPRSSHADWSPAPDRRDPVEMLDKQAPSRFRERFPTRNGRMLASPFAFYRGAAAIMAADLDPPPRSGIT